MGQLYSGRTIYVGVGRESVFGSEVAPTRYLLVTSTSPNTSVEYQDREVRLGSRIAPAPMRVSKISEIGMDVEVDPLGIEDILTALMGDPSVAGVGNPGDPETKTFVPAESLPSYSIEWGSPVDTYRFVGGVLDSAEFTFPAKGIVTASLTWVAKAEETATQGTPTLPGVTPFTSFHVSGVTVNGSAFAEAQEATLSVANNIYRDDYRLMSGGEVVSLPPGTFAVEGSLRCAYNTESKALRQAYLNGNTVSIEVTLTHDSEVATGVPYSLKFAISGASITEATIDDSVDGMTLSVSYRAETITVELVNSVIV